MIKLISGATRIGGRLIRASDGPFEADAEVERRLVRAGVAVLWGEEAQEAAQEPIDDGKRCADITPPETPSEAATGALDAEQLLTMTNAQLDALAKEMGLDASKCKKKADYVELITAQEAIDEDEEDEDAEFDDEDEEAQEDEDTIDDGEAPPDLEAEAPVV